MTFAEIYAKIKAATMAVFKRKKRELTPEEERAIIDKWLAMTLKSYVLKASGGSYNGQQWDPRARKDDGHSLLIKSGRLYNAVKNSTVAISRGKNGVLDFHAEVASRDYPQKKGKKGTDKRKITTRDVFMFHQYGTPKCPARPIFVKLSAKDQRELDAFVKGFLDGQRKGH